MIDLHCTGRRRPASTRICRAASLGAALALLAPAALAAQTAPAPRGLSLQDAVAIARENNPEYLQQANDIGVARWGVRSAYGSLLPSASASTGFGYTASGQRRLGDLALGEQPSYYSSNYSVGLSYELSGSKLLQPNVAKAQERATTQRVFGAEAQLVAEVTQRYLSVLQAHEAVGQAEREVTRTGEHVKLAQARFEVGAGTPLDVRRAEVQQGQAEVRLVQAQNTLATETLALGQLLGTPLDAGTTLSSEFGLSAPQWKSADLITLAMQNNPSLLAARASSSAAKTGVQAARSSYLPSLHFNAGVTGSVYQASNINPLVAQQLAGAQGAFSQCLSQNEILSRVGLPTNSCVDPAMPGFEAALRDQVRAQNDGFPFGYERQPFNASVSISLPVFTGLQRQRQVEEAKASAEDAQLAVRAQELRLRTDVESALRNVETAYRTAELQDRVRASAAEELRLAQERFRFGAASSVEVTDAQTNLGEAERARIAAVYDYQKSVAALEALVGQALR
ncbi:MAG TPA: TolC family protein [Longimicrobiaceae bacterium]|nr:TolC family protein [Longimicrobiaceae bacterium]